MSIFMLKYPQVKVTVVALDSDEVEIKFDGKWRFQVSYTPYVVTSIDRTDGGVYLRNLLAYVDGQRIYKFVPAENPDII